MQKTYKHDLAKIEANNKTAAERAAWNADVAIRKAQRAAQNKASFVPRKAKQVTGTETV